MTLDLVSKDGKVAKRETVASRILKAPIEQVVRVGTKATQYARTGAESLNWAALAECESGGNPRAVNPNGYYGLYQFNVPTWRSVGGSGMPHEATPREQTYRAQLLYKERGASPWPVCGRRLFTLEASGLQPRFHGAAALRNDGVGGRVVAFGDRLDELGAAVEHPGAVVGGVPGGQRAVGDQLVEQRAPLLLGVVVHAVGVRQQREPVGDRAQVGPEGVGRPADVPADRARRDAGEHDAGLPGGPHRGSTPCSRHIASRPATLPPPTQITSWASRCAVMSSTFGIGNSARCDGCSPATCAAS